jgi:prepilin-type N-terminal cleavage/methylation domain-containing protein
LLPARREQAGFVRCARRTRREGRASGPSVRRTARRAFTLVELLLALSLMVVLTALCWPVLDRPFASRRLKSAADRIRAEWIHTRVQAMTSGQTIAFRYTPGGGRFALEWCEGMDVLADPLGGGETALDAAMPGGLAAGTMAGAGAPGLDPSDQKLPEGVMFRTSETVADSRSLSLQTDSGPALDQVNPVDWSEPILFFPDGTTSTSRLMLGNDRGQCIVLDLRGLTGIVTTSEPLSEGELPQ